MIPRLLFRSVAARVSPFGTRGISTVGVVGGGQMGTGIAFVTAVRAKKNVVVMDLSEQQRENSISFCMELLAKDVKKGRLNQEDADAARARFSVVSRLEDLKDCDFLIEAATENVDLKRKIFADLDAITRPDVILATNTSSISITKIAAATKRADKVIGMHFFSPVNVMKICEIISGLETSKATLNATVALAESMDKVVTKSQNVPGFIANRILMPYINEAFLVLESGIATREDIDTTMKLGTAVATSTTPTYSTPHSHLHLPIFPCPPHISPAPRARCPWDHSRSRTSSASTLASALCWCLRRASGASSSPHLCSDSMSTRGCSAGRLDVVSTITESMLYDLIAPRLNNMLLIIDFFLTFFFGNFLASPFLSYKIRLF
jgi:3-hydroxybutyryl-CoA dehydrogenase